MDPRASYNGGYSCTTPCATRWLSYIPISQGSPTNGIADICAYCKQVLALSNSVQVSSAKRYRAEVRVDSLQEGLGRGQAEGNVRCIHHFSVLRDLALHGMSEVTVTSLTVAMRTYAVYNSPPSGRAERLDGKVFTFLHFGLIVILHQQDGFSPMYMVSIYGMAAQIINCFHFG